MNVHAFLNSCAYEVANGLNASPCTYVGYITVLSYNKFLMNYRVMLV